MLKKIKSAIATVAVSAGLAFGASTAQAGVIDLGFALDSSGSVGSTNWDLQIQGFADALDAVTLDSRYRVTFVSFAQTASTIVGPTIIDSQATLDAIKAQLLATPYSAGWTNTAAGIDLIMSEWAAAGYDAADTQYINIATDGEPCLPSSQGGCGNGSQTAQDALDSASNAFAAGLDSLSAEAIGNFDTAFLLDLVKPQPGVVVTAGDPIPNPLNNGFVLEVGSFQDFAPAIAQKIQKLVQVSEPSTALLMIGGLFGLFVSRRRAK